MTSTVDETVQPAAAPTSVACPRCQAQPGADCTTPSGSTTKTHGARTKAAASAASKPINAPSVAAVEPPAQPPSLAGQTPAAPTLADVFHDDAAPLVVEADGTEDRLAQLHAAYSDAKAAADEASKHLKTITDGIKAELTARVPDGTERIELRGDPRLRPLRLTYVESWRLDSTRLKTEDPLLYVRFARKSGSWTLKAAGGAE